MSRAVFFRELYNHKVLPKGCLTLLNSMLLGSEKLSLLLGHASQERVGNSITMSLFRDFIPSCKTLSFWTFVRS